MPPKDDDESRAPLVGTWRNWYTIVLGTMVALVALFAYLSAAYK
jgi:hypothetical protein